MNTDATRAAETPPWTCKRIRVAGTALEFSIFLEPPSDAQDPISRELLGHDELTYANALLMLEFLKPGQFVLDLGAHLGSLALVAAAAGCHVAAVEASPHNVALLTRSRRQNRFARLRVLHQAVSDRPETLRLRLVGAFSYVEGAVQHRPRGAGVLALLGRAWAFLRGRGAASAPRAAGTAEVRAVPVDRLVKQLGWRRVDFIKMDIEGFEVKALRGMTALISRPDAPPILFESNGATLEQQGSGPCELKRTLEQFGYRTYALEPGEWLIPVAADDLQPICCMDCLAVKGPLPALGPWKVAPPLDGPGLAIRVGWACGDPSHLARRYTARLLQTAPRELLAQPEVRRGVARLREDENAEVRAEALRIDLPEAPPAAA
jgi:FkbM family methyltransferase